jgi:cytochrome b
MNFITRAQDGKRPVYVWDPVVRIFHWATVLLIGFSWYSAEIADDWLKYYMWSGYAILTLLLARIAWGFVGTRYARLGSFLPSPRAALRELLSLHRRKSDEVSIGHTPLGGINIVLMVICLLAQLGTGLFANDDVFSEGPLAHLVSKNTSDTLTALHEYNFNVLLILIALHIAAALYHLIYRRENLITPMITGYKHLAGDTAPTAAFKPLLATIVLAIAASLVYLLVR